MTWTRKGLKVLQLAISKFAVYRHIPIDNIRVIQGYHHPWKC